MITFTIQGTLPNLNDYTKACRTGYIIGNHMKKMAQDRIIKNIDDIHFDDDELPVTILYKWIEPNKKRDKDNICFAQKFIQDALVKKGVIPNDGWNEIKGFVHTFDVDKDNPRIEVTIYARGELNG